MGDAIMDGGRTVRQHFMLAGMTLAGMVAICATTRSAHADEQRAYPRAYRAQMIDTGEYPRGRVLRSHHAEEFSDEFEPYDQAMDDTLDEVANNVDSQDGEDYPDDSPADVEQAAPIPAEHPIYADDFRRGLPPKSQRGRVVKAQHSVTDQPGFAAELPSGDMDALNDGASSAVDSDGVSAPYAGSADGGAAPWESSMCGDDSSPCGDCCYPCSPPYWSHKTGVWGEYLYLRPRNAEVPYAVPIDGPVAPVIGNGIQNGPTATVNPNWQAAFAVGGSIAISDFSSLRLRYSHFDQTTQDSATISPPDVLRALVTHPLGTNAATDTLDASASLKLRWNVADAVFARVLVGGDNYVVNYFGGGRYMDLQQEFGAIFRTVGSTPVASNIQFNGGGIQLGLDGERRHCRTGLLVYGRVSSSFVAGQFKANYQENDATGVPIVANSFQAGRIVPMLDMEVGFGWTGPEGRLRVTAGYVVNAWFNTVSTSDYIQAVQANNFNGMSNTITFDGFTVRGTLQF